MIYDLDTWKFATSRIYDSMWWPIRSLDFILVVQRESLRLLQIHRKKTMHNSVKIPSYFSLSMIPMVDRLANVINFYHMREISTVHLIGRTV